MTESEIRAISKLDLKPGDTLVIYMDRDKMSGSAVGNIMRSHKATFPASIKLIVMPSDSRFEVLKGSPQ